MIAIPIVLVVSLALYITYALKRRSTRRAAQLRAITAAADRMNASLLRVKGSFQNSCSLGLGLLLTGHPSMSAEKHRLTIGQMNARLHHPAAEIARANACAIAMQRIHLKMGRNEMCSDKEIREVCDEMDRVAKACDALALSFDQAFALPPDQPDG